eukprot:TRINITY_DN10058_c0_g1_i2.p1 TRINITY_DN10058_c0_g1~~TRINITY_DN10058_c0_g1_i2.p1  ORF type:complete len:419 (-),score=100.75 TRINITY_DN10058_c0_g1_i2:31-1287(-)
MTKPHFLLVCFFLLLVSPVDAETAVPAARSQLPSWTAPQPNASLPLGGFTPVPNTTYVRVYNATPEIGTYNHAAMLDFHNGTFLLTWKNSPRDEDSPGQRVLYSQSVDGVNWTPTDGKNILFPNVSTDANPAALFAEPALHINGRRYAAASPIQFCLYPDQYQSVLLLRRVNDGIGSLGQWFWASDVIPAGFEEASKINDIPTVTQMDAETQADVATLANEQLLPCGPAQTDGTLKCEACLSGCQLWSDIPKSLKLANERTHYVVPGTSGSSQTDVLLYRSQINRLYVSVRWSLDSSWSIPAETDIPDDNSNINTGVLPDGRVFFLSNSLKYVIRDPLTIALSRDGWSFDQAYVVISCTLLGPSNVECKPRWQGKYKNPGPSYPQGLAVTAPKVQGLYVVVTNNKEDVWVAKMEFSNI